jgi:alpha-tubulin suppressor-like RCC1 family protein
LKKIGVYWLLVALCAFTTACGDDSSSNNSNPENGGQPLQGASEVFMGYQTACAALEDGSTYCWGFDLLGQVGDGEPTPAQKLAVPVTALDGELVHFDGNLDTVCGLTSEGSVYCWGEDEDGSLGPGDPPLTVIDTGNSFLDGSYVPEPWQVFEGGHVAADFDGDHGCAAAESGTITCWGKYTLATELGDIAETGDPFDVEPNGWMPAQLALTGNTDCALSEAGEVWCWGDGTNGKLGKPFDDQDDNYIPCSESVPVVSEAGYCAGSPQKTDDLGGPAVSVHAEGFGFCALRDDGAVLCWGGNFDRRFDPGTDDTIDTPFELDTPGTVTDVAMGTVHVCVLLDDGRVFCSGGNDRGQLGQGEAGEFSGFVEVSLPGQATDISAGFKSSCAVLENTQVACWGLNDASQLGVRRSEDISESDIRHSPVIVQVAQ